MPFGKYEGEDLDDVPDGYLTWALDNLTDLAPSLRTAIEIRLGLAEAVVAPGDLKAAVRGLIASWIGIMTKKYPDQNPLPNAPAQVIAEGARVLRGLAGIS